MSWLTTVHNGNTATKEQRVSSPDLDIHHSETAAAAAATAIHRDTES